MLREQKAQQAEQMTKKPMKVDDIPTIRDAELGGQTSAQGSGRSPSHFQMPSNKSQHIGEKEHQAKDEISELENQKLKNELKEMKQKLAKLEMYQNVQQRNIEEIMGQLAERERKLYAKIDEESQSKEAKLNQIVEKIETNQKILQRFIDQITEAQNGGLTIGNQWNANACENDLIIEKNELIVQHDGQMHGFVSVCAKKPIPKNGIFYFEVNDLNGFASFAAVGLAPKELPLGERAVYFDGTNTDKQNNSYEYYSMQYFASSSFPIFKNLPSLEPGDVIGCGVNLNTRNIIYTKNGKRINTPRLFVAPSADVDLFPCVTLLWTGSKIEANFGPNFKYNIGNEQQMKNRNSGFLGLWRS
ncbi:hypothetical protein niasHT_013419 [Heterodera trifolii]|uniref:B30.2/SPRY domain-containing protein n=1 Tax=Heterodera trifolii TaxID=157864 RepID=A0ABD2LD76_9BILA